jgi:hypothetical protein
MRGRPVAAALLAVLLPVVPVAAAAAAVPGQESGELVNDEVVLATLDPTGLPVDAVLISRVVSAGGQERTIVDPASTTNVRYRDRRGEPPVTGDGVLVEVGGADARSTLTEALFDQPLPVALHAQYQLAGRSVDPTEVVGAQGDLAVTYTLTNTTAQAEPISYVDAAGVPRGAELPVFVPLAGTLVITVPDGLRVTAAPGAAAATDPQGRTLLRYDVYLAPPVGDFQQQFRLALQADRGATPAAELTVAPVVSGQSPTLGFAAALVAESVDGSVDLASVADELNDQTGQLAQGAAALAAGAGEVAQGQQLLLQALSEGARGGAAAADGAAALAAGIAEVARGLSDLTGPDGLPAAAAAAATGADTAALLADIVGSSTDGEWRPEVRWPGGAAPQPPADLPAWAEAVGELAALVAGLSFQPDGRPRDGVCDLDQDRDGVVDNPIGDLDCVPTLVQSLRALAAAAAAAGTVAAAVPDLLDQVGRSGSAAAAAAEMAGAAADRAAAGAVALREQLCSATPTAPPAVCRDLAAVAGDAMAAAEQASAAEQAVAAAAEPLEEAALRAAGLAIGLPVLAALVAATADLAAAAGDGLRSGSAAEPGLADGLAQLADGLAQASGAAGALAAGAGAAAAGGSELAGAVGVLADGLGQGEQAAAALGQGSAEVGAGAAALAEGSALLRDEGTARLLAGITDGSADAALAEAYLAAVDERAADGLPYGAPEGAVGHAAYAYQMPASEPSGPVPLLAIAVIIAMAAIAVAGGVRRAAR